MDDLLAKAGSFLGSKAGGGSKHDDDGEYGNEDQDRRKGQGQGQYNQEQQQSHGSSGGGSGDLMGSAKVLMGALQSKSGGGSEKSNVDMGELAGVAANIVETASKYGNLDKNPKYGSYVQKAETYLHDYQAKHPKGTTHSETRPETGYQSQSQSHQSSGYGDEARPASHQSGYGDSDRPGRYQDDGDNYSSERPASHQSGYGDSNRPGRYQDDGDNYSSERPASRHNNSNSRYEKDGDY